MTGGAGEFFVGEVGNGGGAREMGEVVVAAIGGGGCWGGGVGEVEGGEDGGFDFGGVAGAVGCVDGEGGGAEVLAC